MSQREWLASGGSSTVAVAPPRTSPLEPVPRTPPRTESDPAGLPRWEEVFLAATTSQQQELFDLARRQGFLYRAQLPPLETTPVSTFKGPPTQLLSQLLTGKVSQLPPLHAEPFTPHDRALDATQRAAVAAALTTPDLCLIQGQPGTGKTRVIAELLRQAVQRGQRVLLLAQTTAALDCVLEQVATHDALFAYRCLGAEERAEDLPASVRAMTFTERTRELSTRAITAAQQARSFSQAELEQRQREALLWPELAELCTQAQQIEARRAETEHRSANVAQAVTDAAATPDTTTPFGRECAALTDELATRQADWHTQEVAAQRAQMDATTEHEQLQQQLLALQPLVEARRAGRWWSGAWWQARKHGDVTTDIASVEQQLTAARQRLEAANAALQALAAERAAGSASHQLRFGELLQREVARHHAELTLQGAQLAADKQTLLARWTQLQSQLAAPQVRPTPLAPDSLQLCKLQWDSQCRLASEEATFAEQWASYLESSIQNLATQLPALVNVVAATHPALVVDAHFGKAAPPTGAFDLLICDEAEGLIESELLALAQRAGRWVLVGDTSWTVGEETGAAPRPQGRGPASMPRRPVPRTRSFQKLWEALHTAPQHLPYAWLSDGGKLGCRLRHISADQKAQLESEPLADRPDVELRILNTAKGPPILAEVLFAAGTTTAQAKQFLLHELQELAVQSDGANLLWEETADSIVMHCSTASGMPLEAVSLGEGVSEWIEPAATCASCAEQRGCRTIRLEFARAAGWTRPRALDWLHEHLPALRFIGRTVLLEMSYRMSPSLAHVVADLLYATPACVHPAKRANGTHECAVEFVAVPALTNGRGGEHTLPRAGAGYELDLAGAHNLDKLPLELRGALPKQGIINYLEARALVRKLEQLVRDEPAATRFAVLALTPAQVCLLQQMVQRMPKLACLGTRLTVTLPTALRQRECDVALVSLTRSHDHRAVPLGEASSWLQLALTRSRQGLILFGDPGTLARRGQWRGALDHLDEAAAQREARLVQQLLRYVQGDAVHSGAFHLSQGTTA